MYFFDLVKCPPFANMLNVNRIISSLKNEVIDPLECYNMGHNLVKLIHDTFKVLAVQKCCYLLVL